MNRFRTVLGLCLAALALSAGAQVYKWVDAEGVVHYSDTPPEQIICEEMELEQAPPAERAEQARGVYEQAIRDLAARREADEAERAERKAARQEAEASAQAAAEECARAYRNLLTLDIQRAVYYDEQGDLYCDRSVHDAWYQGERHYVDDAERANARKYWLYQVARLCDPQASEDEMRRRADAWTAMNTRQYCDFWRVRLAELRDPEFRGSPDDIEMLEARIAAFCQ